MDHVAIFEGSNLDIFMLHMHSVRQIWSVGS
jgi:hypothetical protein